LNLVEEVKGRVLAEGVDLVGITSVRRLENAPEGRRPKDILPTAQSVVVAAVHVLDSVWDLPYTRYEYTNQFFVLNSMLNGMAFKLSRYLESQGYRTIPIPAAYPRINKLMCGVFSHRHAAVQAGLGELALNNLLTTPQFGSRVRLVSILTEAPLQGDSPFEGTLCPSMRTECKLACVQNCPVHAISEDGVVDKAKCLHYQEQIMPWSAVELRCGVCVASCPVGEPHWKIPAGSRSQTVMEMKELWAGAKW
jgi:epoxyqueuosine reductase